MIDERSRRRNALGGGATNRQTDDRAYVTRNEPCMNATCGSHTNL